MKKVILITIFIIVTSVFFVQYSAKKSVSQNEIETVFVIKSGEDIVNIGNNLEEEKLISNRLYFYYYAWKNKLRGKVSAGNYNIAPNSTMAEIVYKITSNDAIIQKKKDVKITFPEGWTIKEMAERLNKNNLPGDNFLELANNPTKEIYNKYTFLKKGASLEGYLYPDTYFFVQDSTAEDIAEKMLDNFEIKMDADRLSELIKNGDNLHDVIIFASVVEGEVANAKDRELVAGIFKNRLDINMALQSDATIDYIKGISEIKHTQSDIEIDSPYNTYKYPGLPAGPINNPSINSIDAVLAPIDTEYMYFLNNAETGETVFSKTFEEHVRNKHVNGL